MTYRRRFKTQIKRFGRRCPVLVHAKSSDDMFGNPDDTYTEDRRVWALRTYPDQNREVKGGAGDRQEDDPIFLVPKPNPEDPNDTTSAVPGDEDRLVYGGDTYALQAPTHYDTHVEYTAERVI